MLSWEISTNLASISTCIARFSRADADLAMNARLAAITAMNRHPAVEGRIRRVKRNGQVFILPPRRKAASEISVILPTIQTRWRDRHAMLRHRSACDAE